MLAPRVESGNANARAPTTRAMKLPSLALALSCLVGCADDGIPSSTAEAAVTTVPALVNATTAFTSAVRTAVRDASAARGLALTSSIAASYSPLNTIGAAMAGDSQVFLVGVSFMQNLREAGLYQIKKTTTGVMLYQLAPGGPVLLGPLPVPQSHPPLGGVEWMCEKAPPDLYPYCTDFVVCAMFDIGCPV